MFPTYQTWKRTQVSDLPASDEEISILNHELQMLCSNLNGGRVRGVAYDTAWLARLSAHYPQSGFEASVEWLRRHQYEDGTWGSHVLQYHDRFISTLAAIVALRELRQDKRDERRVQRGEDALWKLVGGLGRDDSDTIGFPILAASLADEATVLGLDVPRPPIRFYQPYKKKVQALFNQPERQWRSTSLVFSFEALRTAAGETDEVLEPNHSVGVSPSATAAYLLSHHNQPALEYLQNLMQREGGAGPAVAPIDIFEITWSINHLRKTGVISPDDPPIREALEYLWGHWSPDIGVGYSAHCAFPNIDDTASCFMALQWGGYPVDASVFSYFELEDHFCCFHGETNPSISAHVRLLSALRQSEDHPQYEGWVNKILQLLRKSDENGSFWWDKWHSSPYYANSTAVSALYGIDDALARSRFKWIARTQNDDGGWGYLGQSTAEETAYCLNTLLIWDYTVERVDSAALHSAAQYLRLHLSDTHDTPLWIGKSLYTPVNPVKAVILSALYAYDMWEK